MELEGIQLSEISQSEKDSHHMFSLMWILRNLSEVHGGREGEKITNRGREANHKRLFKYREQAESGWEGGGEGKMGDGH